MNVRSSCLIIFMGLSLALAARAAEPAWISVPTPNRGTLPNDLNGVAVSPSGATQWAVGSWYDNTFAAHRTMVQRWNGTQWVAVPSPNVGAGYNVLFGVAAPSDSDAWAVGFWQDETYTPQQSLVLHWDGAAWRSVVVPAPGVGANQTLSAVAALAPNDVWAVGWYYEIGFKLRALVLHWDGIKWRAVPAAVPAGGPNTFATIAAAGPAEIWAGGIALQNGTYVAMVQRWDGTRWSVVPLPPLPAGASAIRALSVSPTGEVWAVGDTTAGPMALRWDGTRFVLMPPPTVAGGFVQLSGVVALGSDDVWAAGSHLVSTFAPLLEHWDGVQWTAVTLASAPPSMLTGIAAGAGPSLWAVGTTAAAMSRTLAMEGTP
jgi:hypothetical protein